MNKRKKGILVVISIILIIFLLGILKNFKISKYLKDEYEPKYIINELYISKEINYRLALNDKERTIYDTIIQNYISFESSFEIDLREYNYKYLNRYMEKVSDVISAINMDHPELIHVGLVTLQMESGSEFVIVTPNYVMSKDEYTTKVKEIKKVIDSVKKDTKNLNEFDKIKYVYDFIGENNHYGDTNDSMAQSAYSAFNKDLSPVCAGYARASQILFNNIGINSLLVSGEAQYNLFMGSSHAWNIVKIDSAYYLYDVTMSSGAYTTSGFYRGFLISGKKHSPTYKKTYPYLNGFKYKEIYTK